VPTDRGRRRNAQAASRWPPTTKTEPTDGSRRRSGIAGGTDEARQQAVRIQGRPRRGLVGLFLLGALCRNVGGDRGLVGVHLSGLGEHLPPIQAAGNSRNAAEDREIVGFVARVLAKRGGNCPGAMSRSREMPAL